MAKIIKVEERNGKYVVTYESGAQRTYKSLPRTAEIWLEDNPTGTPEYDNSIFVSAAAEYVFYLVKASGEMRTNKLNISVRQYCDKEAAETWKSNIMSIVSGYNGPLSGRAIAEVNRIYESMIRR